MAGRDDQVEEIIKRFKDDSDPLGEEEAIDQIVALYRPGGITRYGAKLYLDRGTTRTPDALHDLLPGLDDLLVPVDEDDDEGHNMHELEDGDRN